MEKLKKQTTAYKTHLTISIQKVNTELEKSELDRDVELLKQYRQQIDLKYEKWEKAMISLQDGDGVDIDESMTELNNTLDTMITP